MPEWATFWEVRDAAGFDAKRSADCVAMNTWPSRGLVVHGVEVKVDRRDWLRELRDPAKSASIQRFCDFWWLAVDDQEIVKRDEVPETWGLLVLKGKSLSVAKDAPKLEAEPLTRGFVAALLRNATKGLVPKADVDERVKELLENHVTSHKSAVEWQAERDAKALEELRARVDAFEKASGINVDDRYDYGPLRDPTKLGAAVKAIMQGSNRGWPSHLESARNLLLGSAKDLDAAIEVVKAIMPEQSFDDEATLRELARNQKRKAPT